MVSLLSDIDLQRLNQADIDISSLSELGRGANSIVYQANRLKHLSDGIVDKTPVVVSVPLEERLGSFNARKNNFGYGRDNDLQFRTELGYAIEKLRGSEITIAEYPADYTLESYVAKEGLLDSSAPSRNTILSILSEFEKLSEKNILHRDIKPDNILLYKSRGSYEAQSNDFEIAVKSNGIQESSLPTRGTATYAHPDLLNAWITGNTAKATEKTELYSLGASLYESLTGKKPSSYKIADSDVGRDVAFNGNHARISLFEEGSAGNVLVSGISKQQHEKRVKQLSKDVPRWARKFVYNCMSDSGYQTFSEANAAFFNIHEKMTDEENGYSLKPLFKTSAILSASIVAMGLLFSDSESNKSIENIAEHSNTPYISSFSVAYNTDKPINGDVAR